MWHERAPAKVNLSLHVVGRRADGYHLLESLVVFADLADELSLEPGPDFGLRLARGGHDIPPDDTNLVLRAARALATRLALPVRGTFHLDKRIPVAAGLGGGSADAAAALRLLARANGIAPDHPELSVAAETTGADVPVCLLGRPALMTGIGETVTPLASWPSLHGVIVNPRVSCETAAVFQALVSRDNAAHPPIPDALDAARAFLFLDTLRNDLEPAAIRLVPDIARALERLRAANCRLARMSGSGASVVGLCAGAREADDVALALSRTEPSWFVARVRFSGC